MYKNVDIVNTFPIKKTLCRWGVVFGFYGQPKSEKSGGKKPDFFFIRKSNILTTIVLLFIIAYLNL